MPQTTLLQPGAGYGPITSSSSVTVGTGSKSFTVAAGLALSYGAIVFIYNASGTMVGNVTAYSGTTLTVNVTATTGSGTLANWAITLSAPLTAGPWQTATLVNSWALVSSRPPRYRLGADGVTGCIDGAAHNGSAILMFTLPATLWPPNSTVLTGFDVANGVPIAVTVATNGQVSVPIGTTPTVILNCLSFPLN